jgi:hypothetical protein
MIPLTQDQIDVGRRQIEIERSLLAQGMPPRQAAELAARQVMPAPQEREYESFPPARTVADTSYDGYTDEELSTIYGIESEREMTGQPYSQSRQTNVRQALRDRGTAGLDNLEAAATPLEVDPMAGMVAAREAAAAANWDARGTEYAARTQAYTDQYGMQGTPGAAPLNTEQHSARRNREMREREARHTPYEEDARIRRLARRAGIPERQAAAMVQQGYDEYAAGQNSEPWTVAGVDNTTERPEFAQMSYAHRALRQAGNERKDAELAARQQALVRTRQAQTNPLEYMNRRDISEWNQMVAADQMLRRGYRGATPLDVDEAREQARAAIQGRLAMQPQSGDAGTLQMRREIANEERLRAGRAAAGVVFGYSSQNTEYRRQEAIKILRLAGYSQSEINTIIGDMFPPAPPSGPPRPLPPMDTAPGMDGNGAFF